MTTKSPTMDEVRGDFEAVFRREFPRLAGYAAGLVGHRDTGADIAQEALARTWARWPKVADPRAYSYLVATNLAKRHWRLRSSDLRTRLALSTVSMTVTKATDVSVRDLVERLPAKLRTPLVLHYYADLSLEEVAHLLHRPVGTVRRRVFEARQLLAAELTKEDEE